MRDTESRFPSPVFRFFNLKLRHVTFVRITHIYIDGGTFFVCSESLFHETKNPNFTNNIGLAHGIKSIKENVLP